MIKQMLFNGGGGSDAESTSTDTPNTGSNGSISVDPAMNPNGD
jgi:hypothetical protein